MAAKVLTSELPSSAQPMFGCFNGSRFYPLVCSSIHCHVDLVGFPAPFCRILECPNEPLSEILAELLDAVILVLCVTVLLGVADLHELMIPFQNIVCQLEGLPILRAVAVDVGWRKLQNFTAKLLAQFAVKGTFALLDNTKIGPKCPSALDQVYN